MSRARSAQRAAGRGRHQTRLAYLTIALLVVWQVLWGFWPSYYGPLTRGGVARPLVIHSHGLVCAGWLVLLVLQVSLVAAGRVRWHRRVGQFGIGYGVLVLVIGIVVSIASPVLHVRAGEWTLDNAAELLLFTTVDMLLFAGFFGGAVAYRRIPDLHKRLMVGATVALAFAGVGRLNLPFWLSPLVAGMAVDLRSRGHVRHAVALDHVAEEYGVDASLQQLDLQRCRQLLGLGESPLQEVLAKALLDERPLGRRPAPGRSRRFLAAVAQELAEAERPDDGGHPPTTQRRVDLTREHPRGGPGNDDGRLLRVQHSSDEALPAWHELNLVEEPVDGLAPPNLRVPPVILLEQEAELLHLQIGQPVVVEADVDRPVSGPRGSPLGEELAQEHRLSGAAHADDRVCLAGDLRQPGIPTGERARRDFRQGSTQLLGQDRMQAHPATLDTMCPGGLN